MKRTREKEREAEDAQSCSHCSWSFPCNTGGRENLVDVDKEPVKSLCPVLSESWDLEETKGAVSREGWVEQKEPHGD